MGREGKGGGLFGIKVLLPILIGKEAENGRVSGRREEFLGFQKRAYFKEGRGLKFPRLWIDLFRVIKVLGGWIGFGELERVGWFGELGFGPS